MLAEIRSALAEICQPCKWDVWQYEPTDVNTVPCVVIGRPSLVAAPRPLYSMTVPVWTIGRRLGDLDSAVELDEITDHILALLNAAGTVVSILPEYRTVADFSYPAYHIDCAVGDDLC